VISLIFFDPVEGICSVATRIGGKQWVIFSSLKRALILPFPVTHILLPSRRVRLIFFFDLLGITFSSSVGDTGVEHASQARNQSGRDLLQLAESHRSLVILTIVDAILKEIVNKIIQSLDRRALKTSGSALSCIRQSKDHGFD
jgi:hypothetical protein